jgi:hypothetical protein
MGKERVQKDFSPEKFLDSVLLKGVREILGESTAITDATYFQEIGILKAWANRLCPLLLAEGLPYLASQAGLHQVNEDDIHRVADIMFDANTLDCLQMKCEHLEKAGVECPNSRFVPRA